jgi:hypothetical protein
VVVATARIGYQTGTGATAAAAGVAGTEEGTCGGAAEIEVMPDTAAAAAAAGTGAGSTFGHVAAADDAAEAPAGTAGAAAARAGRLQTGLVGVIVTAVLIDLQQRLLSRQQVSVSEVLCVPRSRLTGQAGSRASHREVTA